MLSGLGSRELLAQLVERDLRVRYRRSVIGVAWSLLQPLALMSVMYVAFSEIFRFRIENYPVYALAGLLFWNFFSQSVVHAMNSLRAHAGLLLRLPVSRMAFPVAAVLGGVVHLLLALIPLLLLVQVTGHTVRLSWLFLPVSLGFMLLFTVGMGLLLAPLAVRFHDVVELVQVLLGIVFFLTPIMYPMDIVPERWVWFIRFNPLRSMLEIFRDPIYYGKIPPLSHVAVSAVLAGLACLIGVRVFRYLEPRLGEEL